MSILTILSTPGVSGPKSLSTLTQSLRPSGVIASDTGRDPTGIGAPTSPVDVLIGAAVLSPRTSGARPSGVSAIGPAPYWAPSLKLIAFPGPRVAPSRGLTRLAPPM